MPVPSTRIALTAGSLLVLVGVSVLYLIPGKNLRSATSEPQPIVPNTGTARTVPAATNVQKPATAQTAAPTQSPAGTTASSGATGTGGAINVGIPASEGFFGDEEE